MATKLNWEYQDHGEHAGEFVAQVSDSIRIRAVQDTSPADPFKESEGHWPMLVRSPDGFNAKIRGAYECPRANEGFAISRPLERMSEELLVHSQHAISAAIGCDHVTLFETKYCRDPIHMRELWWEAISDAYESEKLAIYEKLHKINGIHCLLGTTRGYCQGDEAQVLVVATPEAINILRERINTVSDEEWAATLQEDMQAQIDLYGDWAWGNVYGYIVEELVEHTTVGDDEPEDVWEEIPDGACWGYYGVDFAKSGLEDAALECLPDELTSCLTGVHSWAGAIGKLPANHPCAHCGELYGDPS